MDTIGLVRSPLPDVVGAIPLEVMVSVAEVVATADIIKAVVPENEAMVAVEGIPVPEMPSPTNKFAVLEMPVIVALPVVMVPVKETALAMSAPTTRPAVLETPVRAVELAVAFAVKVVVKLLGIS